MFAPFFASAQFYPDGTTINSMPTVTDMNGNVYNTEMISDSGKNIIFFTFIAHSSTPSWDYFVSGALQDYYQAHGPSGTEDSTMRAYMYEIDPQSADSQVHGLGNTMGDWTGGHNIPIVNNCCATEMFDAFVDQNNQPAGLQAPAVFVVCSDKKLYQIGTNANTAEDIDAIVTQVCTTPSAVGNTTGVDAAIELLPNPAGDYGKVWINSKKGGKVSFEVFDMNGKLVHSNVPIQLNAGQQTLSFDCSGWSDGLYLVKVNINGNIQTKKLIVNQ